jgi:hypothetical protein
MENVCHMDEKIGVDATLDAARSVHRTNGALRDHTSKRDTRSENMDLPVWDRPRRRNSAIAVKAGNRISSHDCRIWHKDEEASLVCYAWFTTVKGKR